MKTISHAFRYLYYFLKAETEELRTEAFLSAKQYYAGRYRTPLEFQYYQIGFKNQRCREAAKAKLAANN
jgi:hypothetical protein